MKYEIREERYSLPSFDGRAVIRCELDNLISLEGEENKFLNRYFSLIREKVKALIEGKWYNQAKEKYNSHLANGERFYSFKAVLKIHSTYISEDVVSFVIFFSVSDNKDLLDHKIASAVFTKDGFLLPPLGALCLHGDEAWGIGEGGELVIFKISKEKRDIVIKKTIKKRTDKRKGKSQ